MPRPGWAHGFEAHDRASPVRRLSEQLAQAQSAAQQQRRSAERAASEAEERKVQLTVLMETVETLQAGNTSEKDQRIIALTAQLASSRAAEVALDRRSNELVAELETRVQRLLQADQELSDSRQQVRERDARLAAASGTLDMLEQEVSALRLDIKARTDECQRLSRELDVSRDSQVCVFTRECLDLAWSSC